MAFSNAASRRKADFPIPATVAAFSMICAPETGHLKERLALGSSDSRGLPARISTSSPFQVPSFHSPGPGLDFLVSQDIAVGEFVLCHHCLLVRSISARVRLDSGVFA